MVASCPLCGDHSGQLLEQLAFASIWEALQRNHHAQFTPEVLQRLTPAEHTALLVCPTCGLAYFSPAVAGDSEFYRQLTQADCGYYNNDTWDFRQAMDLVGSGARLLDVACGAGSFLLLAQSRGLQAQGIDTNPEAIARATERGLRADFASLDAFADQNPGAFDVVTAFQVLEHLEQVVPFTRQAARCLMPGGRLLVSVPNRHRLWRGKLEPLDCPPPHLSRWAPEQFEALASRAGLRLQAIHFDHASIVDALVPINKRVQRWFNPSLSYPRGQDNAAMDRPITGSSTGNLKRRLERLVEPLELPKPVRDRLHLWRLSMLAEFVAP